MFDLGSVTIGLDLDRSYLDRTLNQVERDLQRYQNKRFKFKVEVDDTRLYELNNHFEIKKKHHQQVQRYFDSNPLKPKVDRSELDSLNNVSLNDSRSSKAEKQRVENVIRYESYITVKHQFNKDRKNPISVLKDVTTAIKPVTELLKEIRRNTKPKGIVSRTVGGLFNATFGNATKGIFQGLGEQFAQTVTSEFSKTEGGKKATEQTINVARRTAEVGANAAAGYSELFFGGSKRKGNAVETMANDILGFIESIVDPTILSRQAKNIRRKYFDLATKLQSGQTDTLGAIKEGMETLYATFPRQINNLVYRSAQIGSIPALLQKEMGNAKGARIVDEFVTNLERARRVLARTAEGKDIADAEQVVITSHGFGRVKGHGGQQISEMMRPFFNDKTAFIHVKNPATDKYGEGNVKSSAYGMLKGILEPMGISVGKEMKSMLSNLEVLLGNSFKGLNPDAIRMEIVRASIEALFPGKKVSFVGFSAGGFPAEQAVSIDEIRNPNNVAKGLGVGTPLYGFTDTASPENFMSLMGITDEQTAFYDKEFIDMPEGLMRKAIEMMVSKGMNPALAKATNIRPPEQVRMVTDEPTMNHDMWSYLKSPQAYQLMQEFLPGMIPLPKDFNPDNLTDDFKQKYSQFVDYFSSQNLDPLYNSPDARVLMTRMGKAMMRVDPQFKPEGIGFYENILNKPPEERTENEQKAMFGFAAGVTEELENFHSDAKIKGKIRKPAFEITNDLLQQFAQKNNVDISNVKPQITKRINEFKELKKQLDLLTKERRELEKKYNLRENNSEDFKAALNIPEIAAHDSRRKVLSESISTYQKQTGININSNKSELPLLEDFRIDGFYEEIEKAYELGDIALEDPSRQNQRAALAQLKKVKKLAKVYSDAIGFDFYNTYEQAQNFLKEYLLTQTDFAKNINPRKERAFAIIQKFAQEVGGENIDLSGNTAEQNNYLLSLISSRKGDDLKLLKGLELINYGQSDIKSNYAFFDADNPVDRVRYDMQGFRDYKSKRFKDKLKGSEFEDISSSYDRFWENAQALTARFVATGEKIPEEFMVAATKILTAKNKLEKIEFPDLLSTRELEPLSTYNPKLDEMAKNFQGVDTSKGKLTREERSQLVELNRRIYQRNQENSDDRISPVVIGKVAPLGKGAVGKTVLEAGTNRVIKMAGDDTDPTRNTLRQVRENFPAAAPLINLLSKFVPQAGDVTLGFPNEAQNIESAANANLTKPLPNAQVDGFLMMQLQEGKPIAQAANALSGNDPEEIISFLEKLIRAGALMREFHNAGYAHRDLHLNNVFETPEGNLAPIDFGSMRELPTNERERNIAIAEDFKRAIANSLGFLSGKGIEINPSLLRMAMRSGVDNLGVSSRGNSLSDEEINLLSEQRANLIWQRKGKPNQTTIDSQIDFAQAQLEIITGKNLDQEKTDSIAKSIWQDKGSPQQSYVAQRGDFLAAIKQQIATATEVMGDFVNPSSEIAKQLYEKFSDRLLNEPIAETKAKSKTATQKDTTQPIPELKQPQVKFSTEVVTRLDKIIALLGTNGTGGNGGNNASGGTGGSGGNGGTGGSGGTDKPQDKPPSPMPDLVTVGQVNETARNTASAGAIVKTTPQGLDLAPAREGREQFKELNKNLKRSIENLTKVKDDPEKLMRSIAKIQGYFADFESKLEKAKKNADPSSIEYKAPDGYKGQITKAKNRFNEILGELDYAPIMQTILTKGLGSVKNLAEIFTKGAINKGGAAYEQMQQWEDSFMPKGSVGKVAKNTLQVGMLGTAAANFPFLGDGITLIHNALQSGADVAAQGMANSIMDQLANTLPQGYHQALQQLTELPFVGDTFAALRGMPRDVIQGVTHTAASQAANVVEVAGTGLGIKSVGEAAVNKAREYADPQLEENQTRDRIDNINRNAAKINAAYDEAQRNETEKKIQSAKDNQIAVEADLQGLKAEMGIGINPELTPNQKAGFIDIDKLKVDAQRFQYKGSQTNERGATGSLSHITEFDHDAAGAIQAWRDPADDQIYVINGHNRYDAATRLGEKQIEIKLIEAKDATEARAKGALQNIRENNGTVLDAAKFFRDMGIGATEAKQKYNLKMGDSLAEKALNISKLSDDLYSMTLQGQLPQERASLIGSSNLTNEQQTEVIKIINSRKRDTNNAIVKEIIDSVKSAAQVQYEQTDLFGTSQVTGFKYDEITPELRAYVSSTLKRTKDKLKGIAKDSSQEIYRQGGNQINQQQSLTVAQEAKTAYGKFEQYKGQLFAVDDLIAKAKNRVEAGEDIDKVNPQLLAQLKPLLLHLAKNPGDINAKNDPLTLDALTASNKFASPQKAIAQVQSHFKIDPKGEAGKGLQAAADKAGSHWGKTSSEISKQYQILATEAKKYGYDIQKAISEGSPGTTKNIRDNWGKTTKYIKGELSLVERLAAESGRNIEDVYDQLLNKVRKSGNQLTKSFLDYQYLPYEQDRKFQREYQKKVYQPPASYKIPEVFANASEEYKQGASYQLYKYQVDSWNKIKDSEDLGFAPFIAIAETNVASILEQGFRPGYRNAKGGLIAKNTGAARAEVEQDLRPYFADPNIAPTYGAILPTYKDKPVFSDQILGYGGNKPLLLRLNSSILEKSTLSLGDSILEDYGKNYFSEPHKIKKMFDRVMNESRSYLEFQYWGDLDRLGMTELYYPKNEPSKEVRNTSLEYHKPLRWQELYYPDDFSMGKYREKNNFKELRTLRFASENPLNQLESKFNIPADKAQKHWATTATEILKQFNILAAAAKEKGYDIQRFISEGSPGTTKNIRDNYDKTTKHIKSSFDEIKSNASSTGKAIENLLDIGKPNSKALKQLALPPASNGVDPWWGSAVLNQESTNPNRNKTNTPSNKARGSDSLQDKSILALPSSNPYSVPDPWDTTNNPYFLNQSQAERKKDFENYKKQVSETRDAIAKAQEEVSKSQKEYKKLIAEAEASMDSPATSNQGDSSKKSPLRTFLFGTNQKELSQAAKLLKDIRRIKEEAKTAGTAINKAFSGNKEFDKQIRAMEYRLSEFLRKQHKLDILLEDEGIREEIEKTFGSIENFIQSVDTNAQLDEPVDTEGLENASKELNEIYRKSLDTRAAWFEIVKLAKGYADSLPDGEDPLGGLTSVKEVYDQVIDNLPDSVDLFTGVKQFTDAMSAKSPVFKAILDFGGNLFTLAVAGFGLDAASQYVGEFARSMVEAGRQLERFEIVMDSAGRNGEATFDKLMANSQAIGASFRESREGYQRFFLSTQGTGAESIVDPIFEGFQKAFASRQSSPEQQQRGYLALEQILSKGGVDGSVMSEELRLQLGEALPGVMSIAALVRGQSTKELQEDLKAANVEAADLLTKMAAFYEVESEIMLRINSTSFNAELARLQNNIDYFQAKAGQGLLPGGKLGLQAANAGLNVLSENLQGVSTVAMTLTVAALLRVARAMTEVILQTKLGTIALKAFGATAVAQQFKQQGALGLGLSVGQGLIGGLKGFGKAGLIAAGIQGTYNYVTAGDKNIKEIYKMQREMQNVDGNSDNKPSLFNRLGSKRINRVNEDGSVTPVDVGIGKYWDLQYSLGEDFDPNELNRRYNEAFPKPNKINEILDGVGSTLIEVDPFSAENNKASADFKDITKEIDELQAQRFYLTFEGKTEGLDNIDKQLEDLRSKQKDALKPLNEDLVKLQRNKNFLNKVDNFLEGDEETVGAKKYLNADKYNEIRFFLDRLIGQADDKIEQIQKKMAEAETKAIYTIRRIQKELANGQFKMELDISQDSIINMNKKMAGLLSDRQLEISNLESQLSAGREFGDLLSSIMTRTEGKIREEPGYEALMTALGANSDRELFEILRNTSPQALEIMLNEAQEEMSASQMGVTQTAREYANLNQQEKQNQAENKSTETDINARDIELQRDNLLRPSLDISAAEASQISQINLAGDIDQLATNMGLLSGKIPLAQQNLHNLKNEISTLGDIAKAKQSSVTQLSAEVTNYGAVPTQRVQELFNTDDLTSFAQLNSPEAIEQMIQAFDERQQAMVQSSGEIQAFIESLKLLSQAFIESRQADLQFSDRSIAAKQITQDYTSQLFSQLQQLETSIVTNDGILRSQARSIDEFVFTLRDYSFQINQTIENLKLEIRQIEAQARGAILGTTPAFFDAAGVSNAVTQYFAKITNLVTQAEQISLSDRRPQLELQKAATQRDFENQQRNFGNQKKDLAVSANTEMQNSQQRIAQLQREKELFLGEAVTVEIDSEGNEVEKVNPDIINQMRDSSQRRADEFREATRSINRLGSEYQVPRLLTDAIYEPPILGTDNPDLVKQAIAETYDRQIENEQRVQPAIQRIVAEGKGKINEQERQIQENHLKKTEQLNLQIEAEGRKQVAETAKMVQTIRGTKEALGTLLSLGASGINLQTEQQSFQTKDTILQANRGLYYNLNQKNIREYAEGKTRVSIDSKINSLESQRQGLGTALANIKPGQQRDEIIASINNPNNTTDPQLKAKLLSLLEQFDEVPDIIKALENQEQATIDNLDLLKRRREFLIKNAGNLAEQQQRLTVNQSIVGTQRNILDTNKARGLYDPFQTAKRERALGELEIDLDYESKLAAIKKQFGELSEEFARAKGLLEELRDVKLEKLQEETDVLGNLLKDSAGAGLEAFVGQFKEGLGDLDSFWRNTLSAMLQVFADFALQVAKQQMLLFITKTILGGAGDKGSSFVGDAVQTAIAYDGLEITPDIPNYYGGGLIDALSLQAGVADAMQRERQAGGNPRLIVASVGERVLNREETKKYKQLESKGILNNSAPNFKINNYAMGGNIGNIGKGISNYANNISNNSSNRDSHDSYSFNFGNNSRRDRMGRSASQQAAEAYERIQRQRRRDGRS